MFLELTIIKYHIDGDTEHKIYVNIDNIQFIKPYSVDTVGSWIQFNSSYNDAEAYEPAVYVKESMNEIGMMLRESNNMS